MTMRARTPVAFTVVLPIEMTFPATIPGEIQVCPSSASDERVRSLSRGQSEWRIAIGYEK
jgi:hypothetical protein